MNTIHDARLTLHCLGAELWWPRSLLGGGQIAPARDGGNGALRTPRSNSYNRMESWDGTRLGNLKRLLWEEWDPIGINGEPIAQDEYDNYAEEVDRRLERGASVDEIAAYLKSVQRDRMGGVTNDPACDAAVAQKAMEIAAAARN